MPEPWPQPPHHRVITTDTFRHVAEAYGDDNPLWCDPAYGATTRWGGPIAPPPLVGGDTLVGVDEVTEVPADQKAIMQGDPLRGVHAFYSSSAREWWAPMEPGMSITRRNALVGVLDKPSEFAERAVHEWSAQVFRAADGPLLSAQLRNMIRTERTKARERKKYDEVEIRAVHRRRDRGHRGPVRARGAARRRAAVVGGRRRGRRGRPLVKGPFLVTDIVCWHVGMGMGLYGVKPLRLAARNRRRVPRFFHRDPLNIPDVMQRVHWDPEFAQRSGNPSTFDYGRMRETWLIHLCTDWMGDDAWLWKLDCEFRLFNYVGDTQWVRGTVARRYLAEGDRPAVDLDLECVNQRGQVTTPGPCHGPPPEPRAWPRAPARRPRRSHRPAGRPRGHQRSVRAMSATRTGSTSIATPRRRRPPTRTGAWVERARPARLAGGRRRGGAAAIREVRSREPTTRPGTRPSPTAGLVAPTWPVEYGGLDVSAGGRPRHRRRAAPYNLGRLNPLGLNLAAPALFAHGTEEQRLRFLPPIVRNEERWCQLFSEPGAGSDLASLATRAERDGDEWVLTGQKVWTTWAHVSDFGVCLARTDPDVPKRKGITYFLVDLHAPGVDVRPLRHITGEVDFNEVFLDAVRVPDAQRVGEVGDGWRVANATLSGERQMVSGSGSGGVDRIGGSGADRVVREAKARGAWDDPVTRQRLVRGVERGADPRVDEPARPRRAKAGRPPGPESSVGKVHQGELNQRIQLLATDLLGAGAMAWDGRRAPTTRRCRTRSRACSAAGPTRSRAAPPR